MTRGNAGKFLQGAHPGYLVDDPAGFRTELSSDLRTEEQSLDLWLISGGEKLPQRSGELCDALLKVARHEDSKVFQFFWQQIWTHAGLADRLLQVLKEQTTSVGRIFILSVSSFELP